MKAKIALAAIPVALALSTGAAAAPSGPNSTGTIHVGLNGWVDAVNVDSSDTVYGWVCMNPDSVNTGSYGSLDVYLDGPFGVGYYYGNYKLTGADYGAYRTGVNEAGYCGDNPNVGFQLSGWFSDFSSGGPNTIYVYWRDNSGTITMLGGSGLQMTQAGMNPPNYAGSQLEIVQSMDEGPYARAPGPSYR